MLDSAAPPQAFGTLAPPPAPAAGRSRRLVAEMALIFLGLPLLATWLIQSQRISLILLLQPALLALFVYLLRDPTFSLRQEYSRGMPLRVLLGIVGLFALVAAAVAAWMAANRPDAFLALPRHNPRLWLMIMLLYPLLSALVQELAFRSFFFHRYGALFAGRPWLLIGVNAALFGFAHIIYGGLISVVLSAGLGALLAWRYATTQSLRAVWLEHSLYGQLVFTVGLGRYFYAG